jgi:hypothetical protein
MAGRNRLQQAAIFVGSALIFITMASHPLGTQCPSEVKLSAEVGSSPPFLDLSGIQVIVQAGVPRTASTFQYYLLCAMVTLRTETECRYLDPPSMRTYVAERFSERAFNEISGLKPSHGERIVKVIKTHPSNDLHIPHSDNVAIFSSVRQSHQEWTSKNVTFRPHYTQVYDDFSPCPLCEVEKVAKIFNATSDEILQLKQYFRYWIVLRQCCGLQQSEQRMKELQGCGDMSFRAQGKNEYHDCMTRDMDQTITQLQRSYIAKKYPTRFSRKASSCDSDDIIKNGTGLFGKTIDYCTRIY